MIEVKSNNDDYSIEGYISMPEVTRSNRNYITTLVNGRVIKNTTLNKTINDAYSNYKEDTRYPIVVLNIKTDPNLIDVNIHPSKLDIKFSNFDDLKNLIFNMINNSIKTKLLIPKIEISKQKIEPTPTIYENLSLNLERTIKEDTIKYSSSNQETTSYQNELLEEIQEDSTNQIEEIKEENNKLPELYPIGLALGTYIICENEFGIYLIDQHAAQERINYEKYSYELSHPSNNIMTPLIPITIELPINEYLIIKNNLDILEKLNITTEEFGTSTLRVISHPTWLPQDNIDKTIRNIIDTIIKEEKNFNLKKFNDHLAASLACKASIKANTRITISDMESIISQLRECKNPFNCPHGRPAIIEFTKYELEKMFKRSI